MASKNNSKQYQIPEADFVTLDAVDQQIRMHNLEMNLLKNFTTEREGLILQAQDPQMLEKWKAGFVKVDIDWQGKKLVVTPTDDPKAKAQEVASLLEKNKGK